MRRKDTAPPGEYKMVLVLRAELRLTPGKAAVQAAHAAVMLADPDERGHDRNALHAWRAQGARKIAVLAPDLDRMRELERAARARGLATAWVEDAGYTEVAPGTVTCLGIGPGRNAEVDAVTGSLDLY